MLLDYLVKYRCSKNRLAQKANQPFCLSLCQMFTDFKNSFTSLAMLLALHISDYRQFSDIHISQGSVATHLTNGGIFKHDFVANLPLSLLAKKN